ncbi:hypothetical protein J1N35_005177 [Gossypium stocksii]|uniref:Uncharacterized protein n=1 Tax=Gossypium stocksii TaxID=47602 RepID=A0A9D3WE34_9ROSI|nr:hypothetical protein J1N35_005177 [Gossypium stocksii]
MNVLGASNAVKCKAFSMKLNGSAKDCFEVKRILADSGSAVEVLSWDAYQKMGLKEQMLSKASLLYGFMNYPVEVKGSITLSIILRDDKHTTMEYVQLYVVDHPMAYNAIFRRPIMRMKKDSSRNVLHEDQVFDENEGQILMLRSMNCEAMPYVVRQLSKRACHQRTELTGNSLAN